MIFGRLEQKLELSNQNMCKKFLKNNAHIPFDLNIFGYNRCWVMWDFVDGILNFILN
jgi:hypothetical protein